MAYNGEQQNYMKWEMNSNIISSNPGSVDWRSVVSNINFTVGGFDKKKGHAETRVSDSINSSIKTFNMSKNKLEVM